ncbi:MAG: class I SAM-dependent methyltransferase [Dehalococcoidia bacterium]
MRERITNAYAARRDPAPEEMSAGDRYIHRRRYEEVRQLLSTKGLLPLSGARILEVGCGDGRVLEGLARLGGEERLMAGVDLLPERLALARERLPEADLRLELATNIPWPDGSFDLVVQFTMLSSITEAHERRRAASEMARVLKPGGSILWYDFIWNPLNRDTRGVTLRELRSLFPGADLSARRITLLPPLACLLAPLSTSACGALQALPTLRTHYLALVRPQ